MLKKISSKNSIDDVISTLIDYYNKAKFEEIIRQESELTYLYPGSIFLLNIFGSAHLALKNYKKAIKNFKKAITLKPNSPEVFYNLGLSFHNVGNFKSALFSYRKAIELKPNYAEAHCNLGVSFSELGDFKEALVCYQKTIEIDPKYAGAYYNLGNIYREKEQWSLAIDNYNRAIDIKPDYAEAHYHLGIVYSKKGCEEKSLNLFRRTLKLQPYNAGALHLINSITGNKRNAAPKKYVADLFDNYANNFEDSLVRKLGYKFPKILKKKIVKDKKTNLGSVLDLGCGTGLVGCEIRNNCDLLVGVDLSMLMIEKAKFKKVYNKIYQNDIVEFLTENTLDFNYFIAADVFVYIGDLNKIFELIKNRNKNRGRLVFSTEHIDGDSFCIEKSGRFSHSKNYIESLCEKYSYSIAYFKKFSLRMEQDHFLNGGFYILEF